MFANLTFTSGDIEAASRVLKASAQNLQKRGQPLWPLESLTPEQLQKYYPRLTWRVAWLAREAVGAYCLLASDPFFWPDAAEDEALYLHSLGVHPAAQGRGLSAALLAHAAQETQQAGRLWLRLDTATDRPKLRAIYNQFGFQDVAERQAGAFQVVLMELAVSDFIPA